MTPAPEQRLILFCCGVPSPDRAALARSLAEPLDWERVVHLSEGQAVLPLVHRRLSGVAPDLVPPSALRGLGASARAMAQESLALAHVLLDLTGAFAAAGIPVLPFKGPTLAVQAYGDPGARTFADLDLLVHPEDLSRARDLILGAGFLPTFPTSAAQRALLVHRGSHETFERSDGTTVELHWRIAARVSEFGLDYARLWRRVEPVELAGRSVPALPADDLLLVLALHGTKHAWERLGWICDVAHLIGSAPDLNWDGLFAEAGRMRADRVVDLALQLAHGLLAAPLPPSVAARVARNPAVAPLASHVERALFLPPRSGAGTFRFHVATRHGLRDKLGLAIGSLAALNQHDLDVLRLPDAVLPLYYLTRPLRLAGKSLAHLARRTPRRAEGGRPA